METTQIYSVEWEYAEFDKVPAARAKTSRSGARTVSGDARCGRGRRVWAAPKGQYCPPLNQARGRRAPGGPRSTPVGATPGPEVLARRPATRRAGRPPP